MSRRVLAALTIGVGALLLVLGSLFPLYGIEVVLGYGPDEPNSLRGSIALTGWEVVREPAPPQEDSAGGFGPVFGYGLVAAAVLAGVGAGLQLRSRRLAAIGRFGALAGFGLAVGTLWAALEILTVMFGGSGSGSDTDSGRFVGAGTWIVGGAAVVVLVGAVLAQDWPPRVPRPTGVSVYQVDDVEDDDTDTPPLGLPVAEVEVAGIEVAQIPESQYRRPADAWDVSDPGGKAT